MQSWLLLRQHLTHLTACLSHAEVISDRITELRDWINAVMVMADLTAEVSEKVVDERDPFQEAVLIFLAEDHSIEDEETLASIGLSRAAQLGRSPDASPVVGNGDYLSLIHI